MRPVAVALAAAALVTGCRVHTVNERPEPVLGAPVPERFARDTGAAGGETTARWWEVFAHPQISQAVDIALGQSLDLKRAYARVSQAEALASAAGAGQYPSLNANAQVGGARNVFNLGSLGLRSIEAANYNLSVSAAYEVDLWGRVAATKSASDEDLAATREDIDTLGIAISARVVESCLGIAGERELLRLLDAQEAANAKLVNLVELRFAQGLASAIEVYQQRQQLAALRAQRPLASARVAVFENQLSVLMGRPPGSVEMQLPENLPPIPPMPSAGVPSEVLARRPDVRAAMRRVVAADHRVGAAIAAQYPTISLSASTGFQAPDLAILFESWVWNLIAGIVQPIFDGGRRAAEVDRARALVEDAVHAYSQAVLTALGEVEDALVHNAHQQEHLALLESQQAIAKQAFEESEVRYLNGLSTYLEVLTALRALQQSEQAVLQARRQLASHRVQLHRALGGSWRE
jgi:NodT family efflux transporter outer membrane factor (OMF) lipoprotein